MGVAAGYSGELVGSATAELGVLEYTGSMDRRGILALSVKAGAREGLKDSDAGMKIDKKGAGRSLSGSSPEGMASRADVMTETIGTMGSSDSIGFGTSVGAYSAGVSIVGVCPVDSATSLTGADSTTAAEVATGALEVAGADETGAVDPLLPLRPMQAKLIACTFAGLRTSASSVHFMST
jgi:hypothetical protein